MQDTDQNRKMLSIKQSPSREGAGRWIIIGSINAEAEITTTMPQESGVSSKHNEVSRHCGDVCTIFVEPLCRCINKHNSAQHHWILLDLAQPPSISRDHIPCHLYTCIKSTPFHSCTWYLDCHHYPYCNVPYTQNPSSTSTKIHCRNSFLRASWQSNAVRAQQERNFIA